MSKPIIGVTVGTPINPDKFAGKSAYDLAVKYGYKGTEEEWTKSLPGKSAYDYAVELGFNGTLEEYKAACEAQRILAIVRGDVALSVKIVDGVLFVSECDDEAVNYVRLADTITGKVYCLSISNGKLMFAESEE